MKSILLFSVFLFSAVNARADIKGYRCFGTEPFFNVNIKGNTVSFKFVGDDEVVTQVTGPISATGMQEGYVTVYKSLKKDLNVSIVSGTCSDGMSDNEYGYHMVYTKNDLVLYGCCEPLAQD